MTTLPLLACVDVDHRGPAAAAAAILFLDRNTPHALAEHMVSVDRVAVKSFIRELTTGTP